MATIDLTPARVDFIFVRGDTWSVEFKFPDPANEGQYMDLSGSTWAAQIREGHASSLEPDPHTAVLFAEWDIDDSNQQDGVIKLRLEEDITATADVAKTYWYDLQQVRMNEEATPNLDTATPVQGKITVVPDVTVLGATPPGS